MIAILRYPYFGTQEDGGWCTHHAEGTYIYVMADEKYDQVAFPLCDAVVPPPILLDT